MSIHLLNIICTFYLATLARCDASRRSFQHSYTPGGVRDKHDGQSIGTHVFGESIPLLSSRTDLIRHNRVHNSYEHEVMFVIRQNNMDELTRVLHDVSDPSSPNYGQHWTKDEVVALTANLEGRDAVTSYLQSKRASVISTSAGGEYVIAKACTSVWEAVFNTEFYTFHQTQSTGSIKKVVRAEKYWIPRELETHIDSAFNVIDIPIPLFGNLPKSIPKPVSESNTLGSSFRYITPGVIRNYYNMSQRVTGSVLSTQATFASIGQYLSPADLNYFQTQQGLTVQPISKSYGNYTSNLQCVIDGNKCIESNLDIQYIMGISQISPTTYWYTDSDFSSWLFAVANTMNPPLVLSISYGQSEQYTSYSELNTFNNEAIKLGAMGVSIFVASGDNGANSPYVQVNGVSSCGYSPSFPATCPYVTSVGATSGAESDTTEVVCQGSIHGITSGGGFSNYYSQSSFQTSFVANYFTSAATAGQLPVSGYGSGRGYPDVSLAGFNYLVRIGGSDSYVAGTSASCPVIAGMFSNINAARMAVGKGSVGWLNPAFYANYKLFSNDITNGNNLCAADGTCCREGYYATPGWDPTTGLGSVNYGLLSSVLVKLGTVDGISGYPTLAPTTKSPTITPSNVITNKPTTHLPTTQSATYKPTVPLTIPMPSSNPTFAHSTNLPSAVPTLSLTGLPSISQSLKPTMTSMPSVSPSVIPTQPTQSKTFSTLSPTASILSIIQASQTLLGVTIVQASSSSFAFAIQQSISNALSIPVTAVIGVSVVANRRKLLSGVIVSYTVNLISGRTSDSLANALTTFVSSDNFVTNLSANSGIVVSGVGIAIISNMSPTYSPSKSPLITETGYPISIAAVIGGAVAGGSLLIVIIVLGCYCCCYSRQLNHRPSLTAVNNVSVIEANENYSYLVEASVEVPSPPVYVDNSVIRAQKNELPPSYHSHPHPTAPPHH